MATITFIGIFSRLPITLRCGTLVRATMRALLLLTLPGLAVQAAESGTRCEAFTGKSFGDEIKIYSATVVPGKENLPEHCDVRGVIWPEAKFAIKLPTAGWNERFQMVGNGGTAGV